MKSTSYNKFLNYLSTFCTYYSSTFCIPLTSPFFICLTKKKLKIKNLSFVKKFDVTSANSFLVSSSIFRISSKVKPYHLSIQQKICLWNFVKSRLSALR